MHRTVSWWSFENAAFMDFVEGVRISTWGRRNRFEVSAQFCESGGSATAFATYRESRECRT